jgi:hypothetical protein
MVKLKERALARKGTASKRGKAGTKVNSARAKAAKRAGAKARAKRAAHRVATKTKAKRPRIKSRARRAAPKKAGPRSTEAARQAAEATVVVDIIEEPGPGIVVVTEFESVRTSGPEVPTPQPEGGESSDLAEREKDEE